MLSAQIGAVHVWVLLFLLSEHTGNRPVGNRARARTANEVCGRQAGRVRSNRSPWGIASGHQDSRNTFLKLRAQIPIKQLI